MTTAERLAAVLAHLTARVEGSTSAPAVRIRSIVLSLEVGDLAVALEEIRIFGDLCARMGVAGRMSGVLGEMLDAHGLATLIAK